MRIQEASVTFEQSRPLLPIVIVGHVDHGKSTLVGRLLHETDSLPDGKYEQIKAVCERRGMVFEWAFLLDALQAERNQGITIDTSRIIFKSDRRDYVLIDAPGHKEFLKNMITGAAAAQAALLLIDAKEGVREQSKRHGFLLSLLGVDQVAVVVNKMDLVDFDEARFKQIVEEYTAYLKGLGVTPTCFIPTAARDGDNISGLSGRTSWYHGPSVLDALDEFEVPLPAADQPLRLPLQGVYKFDERRILAGRVESGTLKVGDELVFSPSNKVGRVASIEAWNVAHAPTETSAGHAVGFTLEEQIYVDRGEVASHLARAPIETNVFKARLFWLGHNPLTVGSRYTLKLMTGETPVTVQSIETAIDTDNLARSSTDKVERNQVAEVVLRAPKLIALDEHAELPRTGRFVLMEEYMPVGGGVISMEGYPDQRDQVTIRATNIYAVEHSTTYDERVARNGHHGGVLWFTGLSGAGKSTLALALEQQLFARGYHVYVLDGDNVRHGLNANLGFSPEDRAENIRRVGEVAALFADAGTIVVTSFISPYRADRDRARQAVKVAGGFHEVYVAADLATCEERDPKGLYKRARAGKIKEFTGIDSPYEAPDTADLVIRTDQQEIEACLRTLVDYVEANFKKTG